MTKMTIKQASDNSGIPANLIRAVLKRVGRDSLADIRNHGIDGGYGGFIYYSDTVAFFKRYRAEICAMVDSMASELGENPVDMVAGFNCLAGREMKREHTSAFDNRARAHNQALLAEYRPSVSRCLYGGRLKEEDTYVVNALAWFAAEEVARAFEQEG